MHFSTFPAVALLLAGLSEAAPWKHEYEPHYAEAKPTETGLPGHYHLPTGLPIQLPPNCAYVTASAPALTCITGHMGGHGPHPTGTKPPHPHPTGNAYPIDYSGQPYCLSKLTPKEPQPTGHHGQIGILPYPKQETYVPCYPVGPSGGVSIHIEAPTWAHSGNWVHPTEVPFKRPEY